MFGSFRRVEEKNRRIFETVEMETKFVNQQIAKELHTAGLVLSSSFFFCSTFTYETGPLAHSSVNALCH